MSDGGTFMLVLRMGVSLALVLGILVLVVRYLERRGVGVGGNVGRGGRGRRGRSHRRRPVEILQRTPLSKSASVQVVRVGERVLVLGVTDSSVRVLTDLEPADVEGDRDVRRTDVVALRELDGPRTPAQTGIAARAALPALRAVTRRQDGAARTIVGKLSQGEGKHRVARAGRERR